MGWFARLYDRRVVNVNVNIVVAGILAMGITVGVMHVAERAGILKWLDDVLPVSYELIINALTFLVDVIADVAVYYVLHFLANHMPRRSPRPKGPGYADMSFVRDATLVQFERTVLSPLLYVIALGLQHALLKGGHTVAFATAVGFSAGIAAVRVLHTFWMLRNEKRAIEGGTDLIAATPFVERVIRWLMPRHANPAGPDPHCRTECSTAATDGSPGVTPRPSGSPPSADPAARTAGAASPGAHDRIPAPAVPPPAPVKTPT